MFSLAFFCWKAADTFKVGRCRCAASGLFLAQDQKSYTLCWRSVLGDSRDVVPNRFAQKGAQYGDYEW